MPLWTGDEHVALILHGSAPEARVGQGLDLDGTSTISEQGIECGRSQSEAAAVGSPASFDQHEAAAGSEQRQPTAQRVTWIGQRPHEVASENDIERSLGKGGSRGVHLVVGDAHLVLGRLPLRVRQHPGRGIDGTDLEALLGEEDRQGPRATPEIEHPRGRSR